MDISVIIPTFKPDDYIYECLCSLVAQKTDELIFEVIIVLNGCKWPYYNSLKKCIDSKLKNLNANLLHTDAPGVSNARNIALEQAKGQYITFIDDDDIVSENFLQGLFANANKNTVAASNVKTFTDDISICGDDYISRAFNRQCSRDELTALQMRKFLSSACAKLIPRNIIGNCRFDTNMIMAEDSIFMLEISRDIVSMRLASPDIIYYRRLRKSSASRRLLSRYEIIKNLAHGLRKCFSFIARRPFKYNHLVVYIKIMALVGSVAIRLTKR